ncbi:MAG: hypothetical protein ACRDLB_14175, partial [Actinomycetota bacterium]
PLQDGLILVIRLDRRDGSVRPFIGHCHCTGGRQQECQRPIAILPKLIDSLLYLVGGVSLASF